jgi:hypothetical protein
LQVALIIKLLRLRRKYNKEKSAMKIITAFTVIVLCSVSVLLVGYEVFRSPQDKKLDPFNIEMYFRNKKKSTVDQIIPKVKSIKSNLNKWKRKPINKADFIAPDIKIEGVA